MTKTFWIIINETKTKMKTKDENDIKINSFSLDDIDENI